MMHGQKNIKIRIIYSQCVPVSLFAQHAKGMCRIILSSVTFLATLFHIIL